MQTLIIRYKNLVLFFHDAVCKDGIEIMQALKLPHKPRVSPTGIEFDNGYFSDTVKREEGNGKRSNVAVKTVIAGRPGYVAKSDIGYSSKRMCDLLKVWESLGFSGEVVGAID